MPDRPLFSILTSSYNHANLLHGWADCIINQDYRPIEVIFVDDASQTNDIAVMEELAPKLGDESIRVVRLRNETNLFCAASYLIALQASSGNYLGILDSDDQIHHDAVSRVMSLYLNNQDLGFIYTQFNWCNKHLAKVRKGFCRLPTAGKSLLTAELSPGCRHCYSHWRTFKKLPDIESIFKPGMKCSVDKYMGYRLEELAPGGFYNRSCYSYRADLKGSITKNNPSIATWKKVRQEALVRRKTNKIKPFPIRQVKL